MNYFMAYQEESRVGAAIHNEITNMHPVQRIVYLNEKHMGKMFVLLFWSEVSDEIAELYSSRLL